MTDYFTEWVEAEPLANIRDQDIKRFVWLNIVTRFGVPNTLISDNRLQFDSKTFRRYCCDLGINNRYSTPAYPQGNGQAEATNKIIVDGLKKRLEETRVYELPNVLWVYCTMPRKSTEETPLSMTYDSEAIIPLEMGFPTLRTNQFDNSNNEQLLSNSLDFGRRAKGSRCR